MLRDVAMRAAYLASSSVTRRSFLTSCGTMVAASMFDARHAAAVQQAPLAVELDRALVADLVAANHILANEGVLDALGHVSARHDRDPTRYLLSQSRAAELVEVDDLMKYDLDSSPVVSKDRPMYLERFIHGEIYKARPDVKAVVHSHAPSLIPFGVTGVVLRPVHQSGAFMGDGVPVFEIRDAGGMTDLLVRNAPLGRALAQTLGKTHALLMRGHGAVVVGPSLPMVVRRSINFELNARLQAQALALGGPLTYLEPEEVRKIMAREDAGLDRAWELWKRKVMARH
jgi:ribulose-5-phosphate 4-epimerase/fuculose-1-phosphate aldolase